MTISCVAVFGGSGFLGRAIVSRLAATGATVRVGGAVTLTLGVELICYHSLMHTVTYHRHRFPAEVTGVPLSDFGESAPHSRCSPSSI
jgi:ABC-type antimicrobial peptide transport system permease subunit